MSHGSARRQGRFDILLSVAAVACVLLALAVVAGLLWWVRLLTATPAAPTVARVPAPVSRPAEERVTGPTREAIAERPRRVLLPTAAAVARTPEATRSGAPTAATEVPPSPVPTRGANVDAAKNRAIGAALSRLADDPELQRRLGMDPKQIPR